jgi:hypothetical protein
MKKALLIPVYFLVVIFAVSCKKEHPAIGVTNPEGLYTLRINLSNFSEQITNGVNKLKVDATASDSASLSMLVDSLHFILYNTDGNGFQEARQGKKNANFGKFVLQVRPGDYILSVIGESGGKNISFTDQFSTIEQTVGLDGYYISNGTSGFKDLAGINPTLARASVNPWISFYDYNAPLSVVSSDVNRTVTLRNALSQLIVNIKDAIPASIKYISVTVENNKAWYSTHTGKSVWSQDPNNHSPKPLPYYNLVPVPATEIGKTNFKIYNNMMCDSTVDVEIACFDQNKLLMVKKTVNNIAIKPNEQVILTGNMFGSETTNTGFNIKVNVGWDPVVLTQTF